jgi:hypothetical protein
MIVLDTKTAETLITIAPQCVDLEADLIVKGYL